MYSRRLAVSKVNLRQRFTQIHGSAEDRPRSRLAFCPVWKCALFVHTLSMRVVWSRAKAAANLLKHRVDFAEARDALDDDRALTKEDKAHGEQRFRSLVMSPNGTVLVVVFAIIDQETTRLISARTASKSERQIYFKRL